MATTERKSRARRTRTYYVQNERIDVWIQPVEATSKKDAVRRFREGDYDLKESFFDYHAGYGKVTEVTRDDD